jgi:hypothetical protein
VDVHRVRQLVLQRLHLVLLVEQVLIKRIDLVLQVRDTRNLVLRGLRLM